MRILLLFSVLFVCSSSWGKKLSDYSPYEYDVRFTNPVCKKYLYDEAVESRSGEWLDSKPKNAYCKQKDAYASGRRDSSPLTKLLSWINDTNTKEIFFTYLSFSNRTVLDALCQAVVERDVKIRFVLDQNTGLSAAESLLSCEASSPELNPELFLRGHVSGIGYAHNKIFMVNPRSTDEIKIAYGSANMSSGIVLHHENWHFVTTHVESYFAQAHLCVADAEIAHSDSGKTFRRYMKDCLNSIGKPQEDDIQVYFVPGQGKEALGRISEALSWASEVKLAAHRFSYSELIDLLEEGLKNQFFRLRLIFDDDLFWVGETSGLSRPNTRHENRKVKSLISAGAEVRYIETNHKSRLLHHNKFIVFKNGRRRAAFFGAGNFTGTAFRTNLENFYYTEDPAIAKKMSNQFEHLYHKLGTAEEDLPWVEVTP